MLKLIILILLQFTPNFQYNNPLFPKQKHENQQQRQKIIVYDQNGDSIDTGSSRSGNPDNMWEPGYQYYYWNGRWYRLDENGDWEQWRSLWNIGLLGFDWRSGYYISVDPDPYRYYQYKPQCLGDGSIFLLFLLIIYAIIRVYPELWKNLKIIIRFHSKKWKDRKKLKN